MPKATTAETTADALVHETEATQSDVTIAPKKRGRPTREEAQTKQKRREQADFLTGCTLEERAYCVRLVRLLRDNYWMAECVRQILDKEARSKWQWTIKGLRSLLDNFDVIETLASNAQRLGNDWSNHPILKAVRREIGEDEIAEYKSNNRIQALIDSAAKK